MWTFNACHLWWQQLVMALLNNAHLGSLGRVRLRCLGASSFHLSFFLDPFPVFFSRSSLSVRIWPRSHTLYVYFFFLLLSIFEGLEWTTAQIAACSSGAIRKLRRCVSGRILRLRSYVLPLADPTCPALVSAAYRTGRPPPNISSNASKDQMNPKSAM